MSINVVVAGEPSSGINIFIQYNRIFVKWSHLWIFKTKAKFEECCCIVHFYQVFEMFLLVIHDLLFIQLQTAVVSLSAAPLHEVPSHKKVESNKQSQDSSCVCYKWNNGIWLLFPENCHHWIKYWYQTGCRIVIWIWIVYCFFNELHNLHTLKTELSLGRYNIHSLCIPWMNMASNILLFQ